MGRKRPETCALSHGTDLRAVVDSALSLCICDVVVLSWPTATDFVVFDTAAPIRRRAGGGQMRLPKLLKGLVVGAAGIAISAGTIVGLAPAAHANPEYYCASGATCVWEDHFYKTANQPQSRIAFQQCVSEYRLLTYPYTSVRAEGPTSVYNNGNYDTVQLYNHAYYHIGGTWLEGFMRTLPKKTGDHNVHDGEGRIANFQELKSGKFATVSASCRT